MRYKENKKMSIIVDNAVEYIITRAIEELGTLTEEKMAANLKVDPAYLLTAFKNEQNISLKNFITREKLHRAVFLLEKNQKMSITEISNTLGFPQSDDFVTEFQKYLAIDPQKYKELMSMPKIA